MAKGDVQNAMEILDEHIYDLFALVASWGRKDRAMRLEEAWELIKLEIADGQGK